MTEKKELSLKFNFKWTPAIIFLIAINFLPVVGVFIFGWDIGTILLLYWLETVIIGILNVPKMWACTGKGDGEGGVGGKIFITIFFAFHFGMFSSGHLFFLKDVFHMDPVIPSLLAGGALAWTAASFFVSHTFSMFINFFGKKEYIGRPPSEQMFFPYGRIVVMHIVIIIGSGLALLFGAPMAALLVLIILKTAMDIGVHSLEHDGKPTHKM